MNAAPQDHAIPGYHQLRNAFNLGRAFASGECMQANALLVQYARSLVPVVDVPSAFGPSLTRDGRP